MSTTSNGYLTSSATSNISLRMPQFPIYAPAPADRDQSLNAIWHALRFGGIVANANVPTSTYAYDADGNLTSGAGGGLPQPHTFFRLRRLRL